MSYRWYVIRTQPRAEYLAADELERDEVEIFFPRVKTPHPRFGHEDMPLFPGYLFLRCDPEEEGWPTFRPRHRVLGWVGFEGVVPSIPDRAVGELRERLDGIGREGGLWRRFRCGERVEVISNGIESVAQVVEEAKSPQGRVKVLLSFMGRLVSAQVPWESLRSWEEHPWEAHRAPRRTRGRGRWIGGQGATAAARGSV